MQKELPRMCFSVDTERNDPAWRQHMKRLGEVGSEILPNLGGKQQE